jgi:putative DNA primase/helicase
MANSDLAKPLPSNVEAERSILGAILLNNNYLAAISEKLKPEDFFHEHHRRIYAAMQAMGETKDAIDPLTLSDKLQSVNQLESSGGPAYLAQLSDGVPHVTNVEHYAKIVKEKSQLRNVIHLSNAIQQLAFDGQESATELLARAQTSIGDLVAQSSNGTHKLHPVTLGDLLLLDLKPIEFVIDLILPVQGLGMLYSPRGMGKTFVGLEIAYSVATGLKKCFGVWSIPKPRRVVYVDGEMAANRVQERLQKISMGHGLMTPAESDGLRIITRDLEHREVVLNISSREGQRNIEDHLREGDLLILDNLSCLRATGKENEGDDWIPILGWLLQLRQRGITVLFIHHAGKSGSQRGDSRKEDALDCVIAMRHPAEYDATKLRCEIHFEKVRNSGPDASLFPFELTMENDERGAIYWTHRPLKDVIEQNALRMFADGMSIRDVAEELHITKHRAVKIKNSGTKLGE